MIGVFIRFCYDRYVPDRLALLDKTIAALKAQVYTDFDVCIITGGIFGQVGCQDNVDAIKKQNMGNLRIYTTHIKDVPWQKYHIQIRLDSDDWISPLYIAKVVDIYNSTAKDNFVITFKPYFFYNGRLHRRDIYSNTIPSPFSVLCQKDVKYHCYAIGHSKLSSLIPDVIVVDEGFCILNVHQHNYLTRPSWRDKEVCLQRR